MGKNNPQKTSAEGAKQTVAGRLDRKELESGGKWQYPLTWLWEPQEGWKLRKGKAV